MGEIEKIMAEYLPKYKIDITEKQLEQFKKYAEILEEWNKKINLTAITQKDQIAIKHFIDSLLILKSVDIAQGASIVDVGTGAGFPGVPLKIMRPDIKLTLIDSLNKRITFLKFLLDELGISAVTEHGRAEELGRKNKFREKFDIATARAVAQLNVLSEYCLPFVKIKGMFVALKSNKAEIELENSKKSINILGGDFEDINNFELPDESSRSIIMIRKIRKIDKEYPRSSAKISKKAL